MSRTPIDREGNEYPDYEFFENDDPNGFCARNKRTNRLKKGSLIEGYMKISLFRIDEKCVKRKRLSAVAAWRANTFLGLPPSDEHTADHIDRNSLNDSLCNLRWASKSTQAVNRSKYKKQGRNVPIVAVRGLDTRHYQGLAEACRELKLSQGNVCSVLKGDRSHTCGWTFRYQYIQEIDGERWKYYANDFEVSDHGRVRKKVHGGYVEVSHETKKTYLALQTSGKTVKLHLIVAELFGDLIERRQNDPKVQVDHIDGNTRNNHISNLRCLSVLEHGRKTFGKPVELHDPATGFAKEFPCMSEAAKYLGVTPMMMTDYGRGRAKHAVYEVRLLPAPNKRMKLTDEETTDTTPP